VLILVRHWRALKRITATAIAPTGASIVSFTDIASPPASPAMISGPRSIKAPSSVTSPVTNVPVLRIWWPLTMKATKATSIAIAMMSFRPSPACVITITPESKTSAEAIRVAGATP